MRLNIAIYNYRECNPYIGGIERVSVSLANYLIKNGINVILISVLKSVVYKIEYIAPAPYFFLPDKEADSQENVKELRGLLIKYKINVVLNQDAHSLASHNLVHSAVQGLRVRQVSAFHFCPMMRKLLYKYPFDKKTFTLKENCIRLFKCVAYKYPFNLYTLRDVRYHFRKMYEESDRVVLLSNSFISEYKDLARIKDVDNLCAINNMLSFERTDNDVKKENRILFCARIENEKRVERALYVWQLLYKRLPDWSLDVVGDGTQLERLKCLSQKIGLERINFHGFKNPEDFYQKSRIFLMTSDYEGWGLTLTEAMQYRCVPIAMNTYSSVKDIIDDGKNGYLIPDIDCSMMADRAFLIATNHELCDCMAQSAFEKTKNFSSDIIADQWMRLFEELLKK